MPKQTTLSSLIQVLKKSGDAERSRHSQLFFKTGPGQYAEGDVFLGVSVPTQRKIAKQYTHLSLQDLHTLLQSKIHEERLCALYILVYQFEKARKSKDAKTQAAIVRVFLKNTKQVNNWDLVDSSAPYLLGLWLLDKPRDVLYKLAKSKNLWEKRIAIMATFAFIRFGNNGKGEFEDTLAIAEILLHDDHDLIHKAVGWMLREVGNHNGKVERAFLNKHYKTMPRTMLRYAIEKFPEPERKKYLAK